MKNKIAIITGAASGIGLALVKKSLSIGMKVVLADKNAQALSQLEEELSLINQTFYFCPTDVTQFSQVKRLIEKTIDYYGVPDILMNNAGSGGPLGPIWEIPLEALVATLELNLMGIVHGVKALMPIWLDVKKPAHIVNTASMAGFYSAPYLGAYEISKHAAVAYTESLFHDLQLRAPFISVSLLSPGWVNTNILTNSNSQYAAELEERDMEWLLNFGRAVKKGMEPEAVAELVFDAISQKRFYVFTDEGMKKEIISKRLNAILNNQNPDSFSW
ncbi:MAG: SDR family NAD(P)-dependent oxidoreductase [Gammaproteobacteria bacterium]